MQTQQPVGVHRRAFFAFGVSALVIGCARLPVESAGLPDWRAMKRNGDVTLSGPVVDRVRRVGLTILPTPTRGPAWEFGVVSEEAQLAKAFKGNGLIVSHTMLELCENDGQLAAVMAWAAHFLMPTHWSEMSRGFSDFAAADSETLRALAKVGYDPRDGLVIVQRQMGSDLITIEDGGPRISAMQAELRKLGYQM